MIIKEAKILIMTKIIIIVTIMMTYRRNSMEKKKNLTWLRNCPGKDS